MVILFKELRNKILHLKTKNHTRIGLAIKDIGSCLYLSQEGDG